MENTETVESPPGHKFQIPFSIHRSLGPENIHYPTTCFGFLTTRISQHVHPAVMLVHKPQVLWRILYGNGFWQSVASWDTYLKRFCFVSALPFPLSLLVVSQTRDTIHSDSLRENCQTQHVRYYPINIKRMVQWMLPAKTLQFDMSIAKALCKSKCHGNYYCY